LPEIVLTYRKEILTVKEIGFPYIFWLWFFFLL